MRANKLERENKYPLTGFGKISYEEFLGILEVIKLFSSLTDKDKESVMLMMDGLKFRSLQKTTNRELRKE